VSWTRVYYSSVSGTFYDAMDFWDSQNGIAIGDPIDGRLLVLRTSDGGDNWFEAPWEERPEVLEDQYAFAASGTCVRTEVRKSLVENIFLIKLSITGFTKCLHCPG
jgi:photosystem II stability/assembly factor-like uncharacterized protein